MGRRPRWSVSSARFSIAFGCLIAACGGSSLRAGAVPARARAPVSPAPERRRDRECWSSPTPPRSATPRFHSRRRRWPALGTENALYDTEFCRTADDVARLLVRSQLDRFDAVVFANTSGELGIPNLDAFLSWISGGKSFLGIHSASDTYHGAPRYLDMLGAEFEIHGERG